MWEILDRVLVRASGAFLLLLGNLKLVGLMERDAFLALPHAIFAPLTNVTVVGLAGVTEIAVGVLVLVCRKPVAGAWLLLWLCTGMLAYKVGLALVGYNGPCGCLVGLNRLIPLPTAVQQEVADYLGLGILGVSLWVIVCRWIRDRAPAPQASRKLNRQ